MLHGGGDPGLLDEVVWWQLDDVWYGSLEARRLRARAATDCTDQSVEFICSRIADAHGITLIGGVSRK